VTILLGTGNGTLPPTGTFLLPLQGTANQLATTNFNVDLVPDLGVRKDDEETHRADPGQRHLQLRAGTESCAGRERALHKESAAHVAGDSI
jgi:hypothetical protein